MSEFSESYHLLTDVRKDVFDLLQRGRCTGYVFEPTNGWTSFVVKYSSFSPMKELTTQNLGILLHYVNFEEHGWRFEIFSGSESLGYYENVWDPEWEIKTILDGARLKALLPKYLAHLTNETIDQLLYPKSVDEILESNQQDAFAEMIQLEHYSWLTYQHVDNLVHDDRWKDQVSVQHIESKGAVPSHIHKRLNI